MSEPHQLILFVFSGVTGLMVGSFLNVCIFRLPRNCMSVLHPPRSRCPRCQQWIAWYDNIPVVSWGVLAGKCRGCREPISFRYAAVELLTGGLYLFAGWRIIHGDGGETAATPWESAVLFGVHVTFLSALVVCTFIDLDFQILPDEITVWGTLLALGVSTAFPFAHHGMMPDTGWHDALKGLAAGSLGAVMGGGSIYAVGKIGTLVFRKRLEKLGEPEAMGFGDVKFMAMVGALLGWDGVLLTFLVACAAGSLYGVGRLVVVRKMGIVAFGPFLAFGAVAVLFWKPEVLMAMDWYMELLRGDPLELRN